MNYETARTLEGPPLESDTLSAGLDHYKLTMSQAQFEKHPDAMVTFTFKNRGKQRIADYVEPDKLQAQFDALRERSWTDEELEYFATIPREDGTPLLSEEYIDYLRANTLPRVEVSLNEETNDIHIESTGEWPLVTFWETIVMSQVNEMYFTNYIDASDLDLDEVFAAGDHILDENIELMKSRPDFKFVDFGSRRHFSYAWHKHVCERIMEECPESMTGTSNLGIARTLGLKPSGTFAHEMPMVYAALEDQAGNNPLDGHNKMLRDWFEIYGPEYSVALTDTFTTDFFYADFTPDQARDWRTLRQDSGSPEKMAEKSIRFYNQLGIKAMEKTVIFSDGLDFPRAVELKDEFEGRIGTFPGIGTKFTNDFSPLLEPLNIVTKATMVNGVPTVKLSDEPGKHTGPPEYVERYKRLVEERVATACGVLTTSTI